MDEFERFIDEIDKLDEEIKKKEARAISFIDSLADELMAIALRSFEEMKTLEPEKREKLAYQAFYRANQLNEFMFERVYKGVDDMNEDTAKFVVKTRHDEEGNKRKLKEQLKTIPPEYHEAYIVAVNEGIEADKPYRDFLYDCFECAKRALWVGFPEISELTGNSILHMNWQAYNRMWYFANDLYEIVGL